MDAMFAIEAKAKPEFEDVLDNKWRRTPTSFSFHFRNRMQIKATGVKQAFTRYLVEPFAPMIQYRCFEEQSPMTSSQ